MLAVSHASRHTAGERFYWGKKESEKTCVQQLLSETGLAGEELSLDALHLSPQTIKQIAQSKGVNPDGRSATI